MIVNRWGKYRALEDFADVKKGEVIDVTGVVHVTQEIMWACDGCIGEWYNWDIPVEAISNGSPIALQRRRQERTLGSDAEEHRVPRNECRPPTSEKAIGRRNTKKVEEIPIIREHDFLFCQRTHPTCRTCSHAAGWDSAGVAYCSEPLGIATLFDVIVKFPITDEHYCSNHLASSDEKLPPTSDLDSLADS